MSCGCDNSGDTYNSLCNADTPYPIVSPESVPSLIANLTKSLYGTIQKDVSNGAVQWVIPCDPNASFSIPGFPRGNSGLLCYLLQVIAGVAPQNTLASALAPKTFTDADMNATWLIYAASASSVTLPTLAVGSDYARRKSLSIYNASDFVITVTAGPNNDITKAWNIASTATFSLKPKDTLTVTAQDDDNSLTWLASGNANLGATSQFSGVPSINGTTGGFQFFPNGLLLNWGVAAFSATGSISAWPAAFPNALLGTICMGQFSNARAIAYPGLERTNFVGLASSSITAFILGIGH